MTLSRARKTLRSSTDLVVVDHQDGHFPVFRGEVQLAAGDGVDLHDAVWNTVVV